MEILPDFTNFSSVPSLRKSRKDSRYQHNLQTPTYLRKTPGHSAGPIPGHPLPAGPALSGGPLVGGP